jgi:16S rRNA C967 or C1407 C5-methylase (RsmB/RsmF family)/NOL1/NOP2/fmu family ribosome biogenesis protein
LLFEALNSPAPTSIRFNPSKPIDAFQNEEHIPWCEHGRYLSERPIFTLDPLFHAGCYYPQEAGSMILSAVMKQLTLPKQTCVLDLCAAPGGKSSLLLDELSEDSLLVANEIVRSRAYILRDNLSKWGKSNVLVSNNAPTDFKKLNSFFDLILVDAPCSGEGMFRKDPNSRNEWRVESAQHCAIRQKDILTDIWDSLMPGGYLIYSTCTFNPAENHELIAQFLDTQKASLVDLTFPSDYALQQPANRIGWQCYPHLIKTEGFYFAVIQKDEEHVGHSTKGFKNKTKKKSSQEVKLKLPFDLPNGYISQTIDNQNYLFPENQQVRVSTLLNQIRVMKLGTLLGEFIGKKFIPHHEYALSTHIDSGFSVVNLSLEEALNYLKGNTLSMNLDGGWHLAAFKEHQLGWFKQIGNRMNNYYPKELRIRMAIN